MTARIRRFAEERDWLQFHDPKSLFIALVGEVGELGEILQWLRADEVVTLAGDSRLHQRLGEELADTLIYLLRLSDELGVDLATAFDRKLVAGKTRFPVERVKGVAPVHD